MDSLVPDEEMLKLLLKKMGKDRIILGSDYPFPLGEIDYPGRVVELSDFTETTSHDNSENIKQRLLWKNAAEFLRLSF